MIQIARLARRTAARFVPYFARTTACSACGRPPAADVRLIAGPHVYLCSECFSDAAATLAPRRPPSDAVQCRFCRQLRAPGDVTRTGPVDICADCLGLMDMILAGIDPRRPGHDRHRTTL